MRQTRFETLIISSFILTTSLVYAHSHLAKPLPTRELHCRVGSQQGRDCHGPCPLPDDYGRLNHPWINQNNPAEVWQRGQYVNIRWHRDNHDGTGFVRLALVPVDKMMDKDAHERFAFHFMCMNSGPHFCPDRSYDTCGNDAEGKAWQGTIRVPTSYPDGVYVLGWSWYGGGDYRAMSFFGDYYSCSFIEIRGGVPIEHEYKPFWDGQRCISSTDRLGVCWSEPCHVGGMYEMAPVEFNGKTPEPIRSDWFIVPGSQSSGSGSSVSLGNGGGLLSGSGPKPNFIPSGMEAVAQGARGIGPGSSLTSTGGAAASAGSSSSFSSTSSSNGVQTNTPATNPPPVTATPKEPSNDLEYEPEFESTGALGVFFLDFVNWNKVRIKDGGLYRLSQFPKGLTVEAFYNGNVRHIDFYQDGTRVRREHQKPYLMQGSKGNFIYKWSPPIGRMVKLQVRVAASNGHKEMWEADVQFDP